MANPLRGLSDDDLKLLKRVQQRLTISEAGLFRVLIHYGLKKLPEALADAGKEALEPETNGEEGLNQAVIP